MKLRNTYRQCYGTASIDKMLPSIITKSIWDFFKTQILLKNNFLLSYRHIFDLKLEDNYLVLNYKQESPDFKIRSKTNVKVDKLPLAHRIWIIDNGKSFIMMLPTDY
ncbi:DUF960 family protein [Bacillus wiedmannii]|uniref:DUF960 domain-containing protein n=1 Tax=Bacillus wiedmannii TaxID=1890302 RepID=A0A2B5J3D2_9BACI|nr:DUF960 family protein [Bacillus wiedmannii]PEI75406.1 hypothetical protein CN646_02700 [Bacillus wiedmannii]PEK59968.1 hypothetical protein CN595_16830 [Bacillus wiedmannii]PEL55841.1 hypothetical protein CN622_26385 [Bacillus wiedmannii]PEM44021.1 hypothetical protein CN618_29400 [Bacillus wiedmannii]PEU26437.1 hypothetical protein CN526_16075 [Bacillus wiedmannii]